MEIITTSCPHDCGGKCLLKVYVENGKARKITTVNDPDIKACSRGLSYLERVYSPNRLQYPMKRIGKRGEGKFERIAWDEALDTVASEIQRIKTAYGNEAFLLNAYGGELGVLYATYGGAADRFYNLLGGAVTLWSVTSNEGHIFATQHMLGYVPGTWGFPADSNEFDDIFNSKLIILWGGNPAENIFGTRTRWYLTQAKERGIKIIVVDPRYTQSAKAWASQWIPIKPGTDPAMLAAMAYVIIQEGLEDRAYLDKYTVGFDVFKKYILGEEDGTPKTPAWAEEITSVPADNIAVLAREYATQRPSCIYHSWAPGRTAFGEQFPRMVITLEAMTGNIGVHGGSSGSMCAFPVRMGAFPIEENPLGISIKHNKWADCVLHGKAGGYPADVKMMHIVGSNLLNHTENIAKSIEAIKKLEFVVVNEQVLTPTAAYADIVLPVTTHFERNDIYLPLLRGYYAIYGHQVIEPMYECRSDLEIFTELAQRLDIPGFNTRSEDEWLRTFVAESDIPDYDEFKEKGIHKFEIDEPWVAFQKQIEDPENNPFPTPSGKIEIFSQALAEMDFAESQYGNYIPPIPKYIPDTEEVADIRKIKQYPLQLITPHPRHRAHSTFHNVKSLSKRYPPDVIINGQDAKERGIQDGDRVKVFNDVGSMFIMATVTDTIMPGVVSILQGHYFEFDKNGIETGGNPNVLVNDRPSPAGAFPYNSVRVQIAK
jgi:anaerobic dimethyl sulfoxide reductase subunit A